MQGMRRPCKIMPQASQETFSETKIRSRERRKNRKKVPKTIAPIEEKHVGTELVKKYYFSCVKLSFFMLAPSALFGQILDEWQAFWKFLSLCVPRSCPFRISRGGQGAQEGAICCPKGVLEGHCWDPKGKKVILGDRQCSFKTVKETLIFIAFSSRWAS